MNWLILKIIQVTHILIILFVLSIPFTNSNYLLMMHSIFIPFMILHWVTNNNTCVLTLAERNIRKVISKEKVKDDDCFTCQLIEPIFDFTKNYETFSKITYILTILLWSISTGKLYSKYKNHEISKIKDLFVI